MRSMCRIILILSVILCVGLGLNLGLKINNEVSEPNLYQVRDCQVVECYPDEENAEYQWVYIEVSGGEYDGHLYEMHRPIEEGFHADQVLEIVFDTSNTSDPTDDMPIKVIKPNMI